MGSDDDLEKDKTCCTEYCGPCGCGRVMFGIFNGLYWAMSLTLLGLAAWLAPGNEAFLAGTAIFTYCCLAVAGLSFVVCVLGFIGSIFEHVRVMGSYLIIFVVVIFTQIGMILACYILYTPDTINFVNQVWTESNPYFRDKAQTELSCCGFVTATDTYSSNSSIPASCYDDNNVLYSAGCGEAIVTFFTSKAVLPYFTIVLILLGVIEMTAFICGAVYFHGLGEKQDSEDLDSEEGGGRTSHNRVVPIAVREPTPDVPEPPQQHRDEPKVRSSVAKSWATRGDRSEASRGNRSVASRDDIDLDVRASTSSGKDSRASETKGNEALFKVAGVMLDTES